MTWTAPVLVLAAYLLGSVPFGLVLCRLLGKPDPRVSGSGNIGATNVSRVAGRAVGALCLGLDVLKGFLPALLAIMCLTPEMAALVGLAAVLGHIWPIYLGFKGGKGVATALGVYLGINPWAALAIAAVILLVAVWSGFMSLGSIVGLASAPLWLILFRAPLAVILVSFCILAAAFWRHRDNLSRIKTGKEHGF